MLVGVIAAAALVAVVLLVREFRAGEMTWDTGSWFILAVGAAFELRLFVAKLTGSDYTVDPDTGIRSLGTSPWEFWVPTHQVVVGAAIATVLTLAIASRRRVRISAAGALWVGFVVLALTVDFVRYGNTPSGEPILMLVALVGASAAARSRAGTIAGAAVFTLGLAIASALLAVVNADSVLQDCTIKCNVTGALYSGAASHGNALGLILAVGLPFVWLAFNGRTRLYLVGFMVFNLVLTGSRTALVAGLVSLALLVVTKPSIRANVAAGIRSFAADAAVVVAAFVALIVPWVVTDPDFATGRGRLWSIAQDLVTKNVWFGQGSTSWFREYAAGSFGRAAAYSSHNQWVEVTLFLGLVGLGLFAAIVYSLMASGDNRYLVAPVLVAIFALGATERPIALALVDLMSWSLFALIMIAAGDQSSSSEPTHMLRSKAGAGRNPNTRNRWQNSNLK